MDTGIQQGLIRERDGDGRNEKGMRNMQKLATRKDKRSDAQALAGAVSLRTTLDVPAAAVGVRQARASGGEGDSSSRNVAERDGKAEGFYRPAWLLIAEGGWWKPSEVSEALNVPKKLATARLASMVNDGYLVRRHIAPELRQPCVIGTSERTEFAVMPECFVPGGLTAGMVAKALAA